MKRLLWFLIMSMLFLAACDTGGDDAPTATVAAVNPSATSAVNVTEEPQPSPTRAGPTATRVTPAVLPPIETVEVSTATARPTRTLAPTITPRPTNTSAVSNLAITPVTDTPTAQATNEIENPVIVVSYESLVNRLNEMGVPEGDGEFVEGSYRFFFNGETLQLMFRVVPEDADDDVEIAAVLLGEIRDPGRLILTFNSAYYRDTPSERYDDRMLNAIRNNLQDALDAEIVEQAEAMFGDDALFAVVGFTPQIREIEVEIVR